MVTPKKKYTGAQVVKLTGNINIIADSYRRVSLGLRADIRFDPNIEPISLNEESCLKYNDGEFFLLKLHYQQLKYNMKCLRWKCKFEYCDFVSVMSTLIEDADKTLPCIVHLTIYKTGKASANIEPTSPVCSMFEGLHDHMRALPFMRQDDDSPSISTQLEPIIVYLDCDTTLPCYSTSFDTTDIKQYVTAHKRVSVLYKRLKDSLVPVDESENELQDYNDTVAELLGEDKSTSEDPTDAQIEISDDELDNDILEVGDEVTPLIYSPTHQIMSAGHEWVIAVCRGEKWYTPHLGVGTKNDPLRMYLLEVGILEEKFLLVQGLGENEDILLISASMGIQRGCVLGQPPDLLYKYTRSRTRTRGKKTNIKAERPIKFRLSEYMNRNPDG